MQEKNKIFVNQFINKLITFWTSGSW